MNVQVQAVPEEVAWRRLDLQEAELGLRQLILERGYQIDVAGNDRLLETHRARMEFASRGQTFAMWLAVGVATPLLVLGAICIILAVTGVGSTTVDLTAAGICLAGSLFAGLANLIGRFLPRV